MLFLWTFIRILGPAEAPEVQGSYSANRLIVYKMLKFWTKQYLEHMHLERIVLNMDTNRGKKNQFYANKVFFSLVHIYFMAFQINYDSKNQKTCGFLINTLN